MTSKEEIILCPLCKSDSRLLYKGNSSPEKYFKGSTGYSITEGNTKGILDVYQCSSCGVGFTPHTLTSADLISFYSRQPEDREYLEEEKARRYTFSRVLKRLERSGVSKGRILDYGAGPGLFLAEAKKAGFEVFGIEASKWARDHAKASYGIDMLESGRESELQKNSFDVATLFDVIEHVIDPEALIQKVQGFLKPGGILILTTPRFESLTRKVLKQKWYFLFPAHIWYFTRKSLTTTLEKNGFTPFAYRFHIFHFSLNSFYKRLLKAKKSLFFLKSISVPFCLGEEFEVYARKNF